MYYAELNVPKNHVYLFKPHPKMGKLQKTGALRDDGYVWYTVATWKPGCEEYFWIGDCL